MSTENISARYSIPLEVALMPADFRQAYMDGLNARLRAETLQLERSRKQLEDDANTVALLASSFRAIACRLTTDDGADMASDLGAATGLLADQLRDIGERMGGNFHALPANGGEV